MHFDQGTNPERNLEALTVPVPPNLAAIFGYPGEARFVGFYWEPSGDEVVFDDGRSSGDGDPWAFLAWKRHRSVEPVLLPYDLGSSEEEGTHWLVIDQGEEKVYVAPKAAARAFLRGQHPPPPELSPEEFAEARRLIEEALAKGLQERRIDQAEISRRMMERREAVSRMLSYLDEWPGN